MHIRPDGQALVTGSADKDVKFWEFEREDTGSSYMLGSIQSLVHVRTLKMSDDILSVRFSPNGKLLAVALLDSTVKLFYQDTLKFFLSLYGHKVRPLSHVRNCSMKLCHSSQCCPWIFLMTPNSSLHALQTRTLKSGDWISETVTSRYSHMTKVLCKSHLKKVLNRITSGLSVKTS